MHDQRTPDPAEVDDKDQAAVLDLLVGSDGVLWSDAEVARAIGDPIRVADALGALHRAGLVHRLDGFVFATRPAVRAARLAA
jgi:hypothetical protein